MTFRVMAAFAAGILLSAPAVAFEDSAVAVADAKRGMFVTLEGEVTRILDEDTFRLSDGTGNIRIYIGPNLMPVRVGDRVSVNGFVDDDFGPREVYADALETAEGTIVTFDRRYE